MALCDLCDAFQPTLICYSYMQLMEEHDQIVLDVYVQVPFWCAIGASRCTACVSPPPSSPTTSAHTHSPGDENQHRRHRERSRRKRSRRGHRVSWCLCARARHSDCSELPCEMAKFRNVSLILSLLTIYGYCQPRPLGLHTMPACTMQLPKKGSPSLCTRAPNPVSGYIYTSWQSLDCLLRQMMVQGSLTIL